MKNYHVYVLYAEKFNKCYIGQSSNLNQRLHYHNSNRVKSTKNKGPWLFLYTRQMESLKDAMKLERMLKNLKSRKRLLLWINKHIDDKGSVGPVFYQIYDLD